MFTHGTTRFATGVETFITTTFSCDDSDDSGRYKVGVERLNKRMNFVGRGLTVDRLSV